MFVCRLYHLLFDKVKSKPEALRDPGFREMLVAVAVRGANGFIKNLPISKAREAGREFGKAIVK